MSTSTHESLLEQLDFSLSESCDWCAVQGMQPLDATLYLRRPACACNPGGLVFASCSPWLNRHTIFGRTGHSPCGAAWSAADIEVVGVVR